MVTRRDAATVAEKLFVYGTLMFPEIRDALAGRDFRTRPAVLRGYRRFAVSLSGRTAVPAIVSDRNASVSGLVLMGVDRRSLWIFDTFEGVRGGLYTRERVRVEYSEAEILDAMTYVSGPALRETLKGDWDPERFRRRHLVAYRRRVLAAWRGE